MSARLRLGVNVDHVATIRQARGTLYPDPVQAGTLAARERTQATLDELRSGLGLFALDAPERQVREAFA